MQELNIVTCCEIVIPKLPITSGGGKFFLMTFAHEASGKEEVSRFFQQTTFGPILSMINTWNYDNDMESEMRKWLKDQMDGGVTPPTSHRAFFRERVDYPQRWQRADRFNKPRHPCAKYSRWREYSFTSLDYDYDIVVSKWRGRFLISVDGYARTLVDQWRNEDIEQNVGVGEFRFCE